MSIDAVQLSALMASRLNHDFVAPLTAISNSCELMSLAPENTEECMSLISDSVESAISLLQFYRIAFGTFGRSEEIGSEDLRRRLKAIASDAGVVARIGYEDNAILKSEAKLIALSFLCMRASFSRLRTFSADYDDGNWIIEATGDGVVDSEGKLRADDLWRECEEPTSSQVHFPIFLRLLDTLGYQIERESREDGALIVSLRKS